jgi:catechol 2,3-dioxygenase-like lactoylglutathione lyase family enzyme
MLGIRGVYEVAIKVRDLGTSERFYTTVLGCEVGLRDPKRPWIFLRAGTEGMIVLQEDPSDWPQQHFAFSVAERDIDAAAAELGRQGVATQGPMVHEWIPAKSLYFADPNGHDLELCAPLPRRPAAAR